MAWGPGPLAVGPASTRTPSLNTARSRTPLPSPRGNSKSRLSSGASLPKTPVNGDRQHSGASVAKGRTAKARQNPSPPDGNSFDRDPVLIQSAVEIRRQSRHLRDDRVKLGRSFN